MCAMVPTFDTFDCMGFAGEHKKKTRMKKKKRTPTRSQEQKGKQVKRAFPTIAFVIHWRKKMDTLGMEKLTRDKQPLHMLAR